MKIKKCFLRDISLMIISLFMSTSVNASFIAGPDNWNYEEYRSIATQPSLSTDSPLTMWQSFSTNAWMKYVLSFTAKATLNNLGGSLEVTVFDKNDLDSEPLLSEIFPLNQLLPELFRYNGMFTALSDSATVRFSLVLPESETTANDPQAEDAPIRSNEQPDGPTVTVSNVTVTEVNGPSTLGLFLFVTLIMFIRRLA